MKISVKRPVRLTGMKHDLSAGPRGEPREHDVPDDLVQDWFFKSLVKEGHILVAEHVDISDLKVPKVSHIRGSQNVVPAAVIEAPKVQVIETKKKAKG